jgi:uroporphyrin-III C-methyltransferase/precorrin-2 dehydrogenase/sirohydrochlorin ferrochelatase
MGLARLQELADGLIGAGKAADTPAAVVSRGSLSDQDVVIGRLHEIGDLARGLPGPAVVVIGDVVSLAERIRARHPSTAFA